MCALSLTSALALIPVAAASQTPVPVGPEFQVNSHTTGLQAYGVPSMAPDGTYVIVWGSSTADGRGGGLFGQRYDAAGVPAGPEFQVNTHTGFASHPDVATDAQGRFTVVWSGQGVDGGADIFARRYDASGVPLDATEFPVNTYTTDRQGEPSIACDAAGRVVIVWDSAGHVDGQSGVYGRRYDVDGQPQGGEFEIDSTTGFALHATVASDAAGNFIVVWDRLGDVFARRYDALGVAQGPEFLVNTFTTGTQTDAFVASDPGGNFVAVWAAQSTAYFDIAARRFDSSGTPLGPEFRVNSATNTQGFIVSPSVSHGPDGTFMVVWNLDDGSRMNVLGQHYDAAGSPAGGEFRVNTSTTRQHEMAFVTAGPGDEFLVTWTSWPADYSNGDIFARRFRPDLIFADGFESGSLSAWSAAADDGGDLSVSGAAALKVSTAGLQAVVDDTAGLYVEDASPAGEDRYRARFYFDPNGFDPGEAQAHFRTRIFVAFQEAPSRRLAVIVLKRQGGAYGLMGRARLDDDSHADTGFFPIGDAPHFVELDWWRSSGAHASDGFLRLWIDGTLESALVDLDNSASAVDFARLGALSVKSGASGTIYWDEFESRRESYIGP